MSGLFIGYPFWHSDQQTDFLGADVDFHSICSLFYSWYLTDRLMDLKTLCFSVWLLILSSLPSEILTESERVSFYEFHSCHLSHLPVVISVMIVTIFFSLIFRQIEMSLVIRQEPSQKHLFCIPKFSFSTPIFLISYISNFFYSENDHLWPYSGQRSRQPTTRAKINWRDCRNSM